MSIEQQIQPGEEIIYRAHPSRITLVPLAIVTLVIAIGAAVLTWFTQNPLVLAVGLGVAAIGGIGLLIESFILSSNEYVLTNRRVIKQTGILSKSSMDAYLDKINNVEHRQSFWGRILGYGRLEIDTASETGTTSFPLVKNPLEFKQQILAVAQAARTGGRIPIAAEATGAARLRELKALLDDGLITAEEYESKRKEMLAKL